MSLKVPYSPLHQFTNYIVYSLYSTHQSSASLQVTIDFQMIVVRLFEISRAIQRYLSYASFLVQKIDPTTKDDGLQHVICFCYCYLVVVFNCKYIFSGIASHAVQIMSQRFGSFNLFPVNL